jgi:hypothetical protein
MCWHFSFDRRCKRVESATQLLFESLLTSEAIERQQRATKYSHGRGTTQAETAKKIITAAQWERLEDTLENYLTELFRAGRYPTGGIVSAEHRSDLKRAFASLPPRLKRFVYLRYVLGYSPATICAELHITQTTFADYRLKALRRIDMALKVKVKKGETKKDRQCRSTFYTADGKPISMVVPRYPDMLAFAYAKIFAEQGASRS